MRKQAIIAMFLASLIVGSAASAAVTVSGEGALGFVSDGKNTTLGAGLDPATGFYYGFGGTTTWFNNSVYITGDLAKDTTFYSELQFGATNTLLVNELNVTFMGLKMGRFTVPFGYYVPSSVYSSWNKLQRLDQLGASNGFALAPGFENGVMYSGKGGTIGYSVYAVQGNGSNNTAVNTAAVRDKLAFGGQLTLGLGQTSELGVAYYSNPDDVYPTSYTASLLGLFGKFGMGALTLWGEYHSGQTAAATAIKTNTILVEADYALSKQITLAGRYTTFDPDTSVANDGKSGIQVGAEYAANDAVTFGAEYTIRGNEGTDIADDSSITLTSQFKF